MSAEAEVFEAAMEKARDAFGVLEFELKQANEQANALEKERDELSADLTEEQKRADRYEIERDEAEDDHNEAKLRIEELEALLKAEGIPVP